jgi:hypothetical protein
LKLDLLGAPQVAHELLKIGTVMQKAAAKVKLAAPSERLPPREAA